MNHSEIRNTFIFDDDNDEMIDFGIFDLSDPDKPDDADKPLCHTHNPFIYCPSCLCTELIRYRIHELPKTKKTNKPTKYAQNYKCKNKDCGSEVVFYSFMEQQEKMEYVYELKTKYDLEDSLIAKKMGISPPTVAVYLKEYEKLISIKWRVMEESGMLEEQYDSYFIQEDITADASDIFGTLLFNIKITAAVCEVEEHEVFGWIIKNRETREKRLHALAYHIKDKYLPQPTI